MTGFLVACFTTLFVYFVLKRVKQFQVFSLIGVPGPKPSWFTGNLCELRRSPIKTMQAWGRKYGKVYGYYSGSKPMLVITDLDMVRQVLFNGEIFLDRPHFVMNIDPVPNTLPGLRGERWKHVRSALSPIFAAKTVRLMSIKMVSCLEKMLVELTNQCARNSATVDVWKLYQQLTCNIICKSALAMEDAEDGFLSIVQGFLENAMNPGVLLSLCFPAVAKFAEFLINGFGASHRMTSMINANVRKSIDDRRKKSNEQYSDALDFMLKSGKLTDKEIVANAWAFILGGFETTSSALTFSTYLLAKYPQIQDKLYSELRSAFEKDEIPSLDRIQTLPYLSQVVSECLRLYPPVVTFICRYASKSFQLGPLHIPQGINIQVPVWQIHHDPNVWINPELFKPERFSSRVKNPMGYIPFGAGPRCCIGSRFALAEVKLTLSLLIRKFRVNLPADKLNGEPNLKINTVSVVPAEKVEMYFSVREN